MKKIFFIPILILIILSCAKKNDLSKTEKTKPLNSRIFFTETKYNFGLIKKKRILMHKFYFKNTGTAVLKIFRVASG